LNSFKVIQEKLNAYIKKYYTKQLLKGILLFLSLGVLVFLTVTAVEYVFWLKSSLRLVLLIVLLLGLLGLVYQYIGVPLLYLFKLKKGISKKDASRLIGKHFPVVGDRLVNVLDLSTSGAQSDLLIAAIDQKSKQLKEIPFANAIKFSDSWKYAKYLLIPAGIVLLLFATGRISDFFGSYKRVVNYDLAYVPPAPFSFELITNDLKVLENESVILAVNVDGNLRPERVNLVIDGKSIVMQEKNGLFSYTLVPPLQTTSFYFTANDYDSRRYDLEVGNVPAISGFEMQLDFPKYLGKRNTVVKGSGNAIVPEGTTVTWNIKGVHTAAVDYRAKDTIASFTRRGNDEFAYAKQLFNRTEYGITTSNANVDQFEKLNYQIQVIADERPTIKVEQVLDSLNPNISYFSGLATDDIKVAKVNVVYYPVGNPDALKHMLLLDGKSNVAQFYYTFPSGIQLESGVDYELYFEVVDNDGLRGGKRTKSEHFRTSILNDKQLKDKELNTQQSIIDALDNSLEKLKEQERDLKELNKEQKEDSRLDFNKQNRIKNFLQKQELQESLMEKFSKQLNESLEKNEQDNELKRLLQERLERQEIEAAKNKKLLEELNKIADKIDQDDLKKRLDELGKKQSTGKRNLEQLVELTKRFYVTEKAAQLADKLKELAEQQKTLAEEKAPDDLDKDLQKALNKAYEDVAKELEELLKDNQDLKKPMDLKVDEVKKEGVKQDQQDALEELSKSKGEEESSEKNDQQQKNNGAAQKQKSAAQKMKELGEGLQQSAAGGGGSSITEDAEMLRQILDNLITFSFKQEQLFDELQVSEGAVSQFANTVKKQKELRGLFEHVDDSLFALSLRRAELSEVVNENITEVYYNIDKALESIADNKLFQGASYQQYVLTAGNTLADFLANLLDNMQQSMQSGNGQGQGDGFQLPDIIKGQKELGERLEKGKSSGKEGKEGKQGEQGSKGENGKQGKDGNKGKEGGQKPGEGESGGEGNSGKNGNKGEGKNQGENGSGKADGQEGKNGGGGNGLSEEQLKEIYEIYKEQQVIRQELEQQLKNIIANDKRNLARKLVRQMESFENDLLENGITQRTLNKMNNIQHQLLKLENAALKQGRKKERESKTNTSQYQNNIRTPSNTENRNTSVIEILNRQALPLRQNFQKRVKEYFKGED